MRNRTPIFAVFRARSASRASRQPSGNPVRPAGHPDDFSSHSGRRAILLDAVLRLHRYAVVAAALLAASACAPAKPANGDLPSPKAAAALPLSDFVPSASGPGLGAELVFSRGATLDGDSLTLDAASADGAALAIVRWLGITPGLVENLAFASAPSAADVELATASSRASGWAFSETAPPLTEWERDGTLLVAARNAGASASTLDLALTFAIPAALPDWQPAETFPVPELPEPSGIDYDFTRDRLWVVDDGGKLGRVHPESGVVEEVVDFDPLVSGPADLEAVRWVPGLDVLLLSNEASDQLLVVSPDSLELLATASLVFTSGLTPVPIAGGDGMEGLAVTGVTDRTVHLILANQNDPQCLYVADLTLPNPVTGSLTTTVLAAHPQPAINLSEVMLDWGSRRLFNVHGYGGDRVTLLDALFVETMQDVSLPLSSEGASLRRGSLLSGQDLGGTSRMTAAE